MPAAPLISALLDFVENAWREPDEGIWEVRGARQHFTHSKVMAWVAIDRAVKLAETLGIEGPLTFPGQAGSARLGHVPEPDQRDGTVLVETLTVGVCSTDVLIVGQCG